MVVEKCSCRNCCKGLANLSFLKEDTRGRTIVVVVLVVVVVVVEAVIAV